MIKYSKLGTYNSSLKAKVIERKKENKSVDLVNIFLAILLVVVVILFVLR